MDVDHLFCLLHINRFDRYLLDEFKTNNLLVGVSTVSCYHFHIIIRYHARRMDTFDGNLSNEVSTKNERYLCHKIHEYFS